MIPSPPIEPMLAKLVDTLPTGDGFLFEPKWDGFRAIVFRTEDDVYVQSRDLKPLDRYFPELHDVLIAQLPPQCILDGEIVIARNGALAPLRASCFSRCRRCRRRASLLWCSSHYPA